MLILNILISEGIDRGSCLISLITLDAVPTIVSEKIDIGVELHLPIVFGENQCGMHPSCLVNSSSTCILTSFVNSPRLDGEGRGSDVSTDVARYERASLV
jgi:hypothetical protein